jgi:3-oxoacyl-[acyl-carrier protein] reductase
MKSVFISGGASGLGLTLVEAYLNGGYKVIFTYNSSDVDYERLNSISNNYIAIKCDLTNEEEIKSMLTKISDVDILINNAAIEIDNEFENKSKDDFIKTFDVNVIAPFLISKEIGKRMYEKKNGVIINISSNNSLDKYNPITLEYDASKIALNSLTHNLAIEFAPYVRVNAVAPGWILTDKIKLLDKSLNNKFIEEESKNILLERFAEPMDIVNLVMFLTSEKANYINSEIIRIDGGCR